MPLKESTEMRRLKALLGAAPRSPLQTHGVNESDCEVLRLGDGRYLATTVDSVAEEITAGLYKDPYTMGWVAAQASLSDLAAVGAEPLGLLFSAQWGPRCDEGFKARAHEGFNDALRDAGAALLGGDTGGAASTVLTGVGIGICAAKPLARTGIRPGDVICMTGATGRGPALAYELLLGTDARAAFSEESYRPRARLREGRALAPYARAAMDTSDGLLSTLNTLRLLNGIEFELQWDEATLDAAAADYSRQRGIPLWLLWLAEHGDFELVAAVPPESLPQALKAVPGLKILGRASSENTSTIRIDGLTQRIDFSIASLTESGHGTDYRELVSFLQKWISAGHRGWFQWT